MNNDPLKRLVHGFHAFKDANYGGETSPFEVLVRDGQKPRILLIACSDSRVDPAITLGLEPGDVFVIRNVANIIPPYEMDSAQHGASAALEYAVNVLEVEHVVVMGHAFCGGIRALVDFPEKMRADSDSFIERWMSLAKPTFDRALIRHPELSQDDLAHECEKDGVLASLNNLRTFPWVRERLESGSLQIHGWYFNLLEGRLCAYSEESKKFEALAGDGLDT